MMSMSANKMSMVFLTKKKKNKEIVIVVVSSGRRSNGTNSRIRFDRAELDETGSYETRVFLFREIHITTLLGHSNENENASWFVR